MNDGSKNYWSTGRWRTSRRLLALQTAAVGAGLASAPFLACGSSKRSPSPAPGSSKPSTAGSPPQPGGTFTAFLQFNAILDPQKSSNAAQQAAGASMSRLFRFKTGVDPKVISDHDLENDLGTSTESSDAMTWTIKLRPDAKFHNIAPVNGHAVEAEDIKTTFTRALDPATSNPNRGALGMIDPAQIQTPDKSTAVFKLKYPYAPSQRPSPLQRTPGSSRARSRRAATTPASR